MKNKKVLGIVIVVQARKANNDTEMPFSPDDSV